MILTLGAIASPAAAWEPFRALRGDGIRHAPPLLGAVAGAFVAAFFSFGGWWEVTKIAGEVRDPSRTLPRALWAGLAIVTLAYTAATLSFIAVVPIGQVAEGQAFIAQVGEAIVGRGGGAAVAAIVIVCVLGSLGAMQMIAPRLYVAMAQDGVLPGVRSPPCIRAWARRPGPSRRRRCWRRCSWRSAPSTRSSRSSSSSPSCSSPQRWRRVFVLRRREPDFQVPMHPWSAVVFLALVAVLLLLIGASSPMQALLGVVVVAAALPVYRMIHARRVTPLLES